MTVWQQSKLGSSQPDVTMRDTFEPHRAAELAAEQYENDTNTDIDEAQ